MHIAGFEYLYKRRRGFQQIIVNPYKNMKFEDFYFDFLAFSNSTTKAVTGKHDWEHFGSAYNPPGWRLNADFLYLS